MFLPNFLLCSLHCALYATGLQILVKQVCHMLLVSIKIPPFPTMPFCRVVWSTGGSALANVITTLGACYYKVETMWYSATSVVVAFVGVLLLVLYTTLPFCAIL